jgi:deoxyribodipyrimidine photo-lyase
MTEAAWSEVVNSLKSELPDLRDARFDANLRTSVTSPKADQGLMSESELQAIAAHGPRAFGLRGGETAACARLRYYFWELDQRDANHALSPQGLRVYQETRNGMLERDDSSKFSPYLSWGCLSPRQIARELINFEQDRVANDSTQWFWQELLWREYFRWLAKVSGPQLFELDGVRPFGSAQNLNQNLAQNPVWSEDRVAFARWREGRTGVDFVDANMRELAQTGWMSNRGRQNVASY